ncbi:MAG: SpoIIE family protein phosphatase [Bacteroidales bacterium]|nr:SpoIIE family protein phosphatase [Bacteroidales bacterium]
MSWTSTLLTETEATRSAQYMLHGTISDIEQPLTELEVQTKTIGIHVLMQIDNTDNLDKISNSVVLSSALINGCSIIIPDKEGKEEYIIYNYRDENDSIVTRRQRNANMMEAEWLQNIVKKKSPSWTPPYYAVHRGGTKAPRVTTYGLPVFDADSNVVAIVASDLSVKWIEEKVASIRPYPNALTSISCSEDVILGIDDSLMLAQIKKAFAENKELQELGDDMRQGKDSIRRRIGRGRNMAFVVYGPIHNGWMMSISCLYRDVMRQTNIMNLFLIFLGLVGTSLSFLACRRTIKKMTRPITELSDAALNLAKGNFDAQMPEINSQDEMKDLRDSFVYMQNSIVDYIEELKNTTRTNERMESELNVARNIQMGMLRSDFPDHLHAFLSPAREVGGDLYDFFVNDKKLYFSIGDVSGKGVPASLMMAITRAALRFVASLNIPMDKTLERINRSVTDSNSNNMFVTLFVGRIDLETGHMEFCNAGHNPIIIIPPDGKPYFLHAKANIAVGLFEDFVFQDESIDLVPGTRIVAYTDGVTEAEKEDKTLFGNERLLAWADDPRTKNTETSDKDVVESLYSAVKTFTNGNTQNDDITILSLTI